MNRCAAFDSEMSLDAPARTRESASMITQPYSISLRRPDPFGNMARLYQLRIERSLSGGVMLVTTSGRMGTRIRARFHEYTEERDAVEEFLRILREMRRRGYVVATCRHDRCTTAAE
jgi:predicted DNA-binding WGR domain protein